MPKCLQIAQSLAFVSFISSRTMLRTIARNPMMQVEMIARMVPMSTSTSPVLGMLDDLLTCG